MSIYVYAPRLYPGTRELIAALNAKRLVKHDGMRFLNKGVPVEFGNKDAIVCWGKHAPAVPGVPCLNASNSYPSMLDVNFRGLNKLRQTGFYAWPWEETSRKRWQDALPPAGEWWSNKRAPNNLVAAPEFEGYVQTYHKFGKLYTSLVFQNECLTNSTDESILRAWEYLGLDFGELYIGVHQNQPFLMKVLTAPELGATGVKLFAEKISAWAAKHISTE